MIMYHLIKYVVAYVLMILIYSTQLSAQNNSQLRLQVELGLNYTNFIGGIPGNINGVGFTEINWKLPYALQDEGLPFLKFNEYFSCKINFKHHRINFNYLSSLNYNKDMPNFGKTVGLYKKKYQIYSVGYGFQKDVIGIKLIILGNICYRIGEEGAIHAVNQGDVITGSWMIYQKPWGWMTGLEAEYLINKNIGVGVNFGYYSFPFEDAKLTGNFIEILNPEMLNNSRPTKELTIWSAKIIYNFAPPFIKTKKL